jgi:hypothetical protein
MEQFWQTQDPDFRRLLQSLAGRCLTTVEYAVLTSDLPYFEVAAPNHCGVRSVILGFDTYKIQFRIYWGLPTWTYNTLGVQTSCDVATELNTVVPASDVPPWDMTIGQNVVSAAAHGFQDVTYAVSVSFRSTTVVIAMGGGGDKVLLGDGDDVLIFEQSEWQRQEVFRPKFPKPGYRSGKGI